MSDSNEKRFKVGDEVCLWELWHHAGQYEGKGTPLKGLRGVVIKSHEGVPCYDIRWYGYPQRTGSTIRNGSYTSTLTDWMVNDDRLHPVTEELKNVMSTSKDALDYAQLVWDIKEDSPALKAWQSKRKNTAYSRVYNDSPVFAHMGEMA